MAHTVGWIMHTGAATRKYTMSKYMKVPNHVNYYHIQDIEKHLTLKTTFKRSMWLDYTVTDLLSRTRPIEQVLLYISF